MTIGKQNYHEIKKNIQVMNLKKLVKKRNTVKDQRFQTPMSET